MVDISDQPLKPGRRAFLKAIGAMSGAALLPTAVAGSLLAPEIAQAPVIPELPAIDSLLSPMTGIRNIMVSLNGVMLQEGKDWVQTDDRTIQFFDAPPPGSVVTTSYPYISGGSHYFGDGESSFLDVHA